MGAFDDLIPPKSKPADGGINPRLFDAFQDTLATTAPGTPAAGAFDDLIPSTAAPEPEGFLDSIGRRFREQQNLGLVGSLKVAPAQMAGITQSGLRGVGSGLSALGGTATFIGGIPLGVAGDLVTGGEYGLADKAANVTERYFADADRYLADDPLAANPENQIAAGAGRVGLDLLSALATRGGSAEVRAAVQPTLGQAIARGAEEAIEQGARASVVPSTIRGATLATDVLDAGGTGREATEAALAGAAANTLAYMAPGVSTGSLPARVVGGAAAEVPAGYLQQQAENIALPDRLGLDQDYTLRDAALDTILGGGLGGVIGDRGPAPLADPDVARGSRTALDDNAFADLIPAAPPTVRSADAPSAPAAEPVPAAAEAAPPAPAAAEPVAEVAPEPAPVPQVEAGPVRAPEPITPTEGRLEVDADTGRGQFRLVDEPAPAGADYSEFGQVRIIEAFDGDTKVGELLYANDGTPPTVNVEPEYQRRGIATAMYELARQQGGILGDAQGGIRGRAEQYRTPAGMAFRAGADPSRITLAPARPAAVESAGAPPPAATPQAVLPASPPLSPEVPAAVRAITEPSAPSSAPAAAAPPVSPAPGATRLVQETITQERAAADKTPVIKAVTRSNPETLAAAREALTENPRLVDEVVARVDADPTAPISSVEAAAMLYQKVQESNRRNEASAIIADPKSTPEQRAAASRQFDDAEAKVNEIDQAAFHRNSEWGRYGQFVQRYMAADYTLEAMESKLRRAKGDGLSAEEVAGLRDLADRLKTAETDLETARAKLAEYEQTVIVRETIEQAVRAATAQMRGAARSGKSKLEILKERADAARKRLAAAESVPSKRGQSGAVTNPVAMLADVIDIGAWHVANGAVKLADWVKAMTADLGSRFTALQDRWPDLFAAAKRANVPAKPDAPTTAEVLATIDPANVTREDVRDLVMARIRAGEKDADAIMKAVTADVQTVAPSLTEADVRQLFADYGKRASPTRDADKQTLRDLRTVVRLEKDIAEAEAGLPRKTPVARQRASEEIRQLRARLSELLKQATRRARTPEAEAVLTEKRREVLAKQIADLEDMIATGRRPAKRERPDERQPELAARRDELQREIRRIDAAMRPRRSPDEVYQQRRGTSIAREIERVQARIAAGDYARSPRVPKALNEANQEAFYRLEKLRQDFRSRQFFAELQQRSRAKRYLDNTASGLNMARAVMTSFDLSALLRQGGFVALGHPVRAAESIPDMLKAFISERAALNVENDIKDRDNAPLYKRAGLQITDDSGSLSKMEEAYMTRFLNKLERKPGQPARNFARTVFNVATAPVRGSARAYSTFLNKLRADSFDAMLASLQRGAEPTDAEIKAIANYINVATGRGKVPLMSESAAAGLNTVFFAPKLVASRFQLLAGQPLYGGSNRTRAMIAQDYARYLTGVATVYALGAMLNATLDEDEDDRRPFIELDPRSSSFGRMRFGDWFVDPLSGLAQVSTILARSIGGETKTAAGDVKPMRDNYRLSNLLYDTGEMLDRAGFESLAGAFPDAPNYEKMGIADQSVADAIGSFVRSKLAPFPGAVVNTLTAENMVGQATTPTDEAVGLITPMTFGNVADAMRDNGVPGGTALTMAEIFGMGVQFRDRSSFDAPDYADLDFDQKREYSAYLQRTQNMKQDLQVLRDLANSFPADTSASDVRDAVQMKAEELGLDGIDVAQYARKTTARDERGIRKTGLIRTETGRVKMKYAKGSRTKLMMDTEEKVDKINREMEDFIRQPMSDEMIDKKYREYVSGGEANGDKSLVIRQMRDQREQAIKLFMEAVNED